MINMINNVINNLKVGDVVLINDWDSSMEVRGVSSHYVLISNNTLEEYSVISKWSSHGKFYCGPDDYLFGSELQSKHLSLYKFTNESVIKEYLNLFETSQTNISERNKVEINFIKVIHLDGTTESAKNRRNFKIIS